MKLNIKQRASSAWGSVKNAARITGHGIANIVTRDRESFVIRRRGKHLKIRNGATKANITYVNPARAKAVTKVLIDSTEEEIGKCPIQ